MPKKRRRAADKVAVQNAVKTLAANIRFASVDEPVCSIVVASTIPNEGKTFVAELLAQALAAGGRPVLIMECDMRKRSLAPRLGAHCRHGLYGVLSGEVDVNEAVVRTSTPNLYFLDCEPNIPNPTDILSSKRFRGLLKSLRREFAYVVLDTPPLSVFVDAAVLGSVADATLLVVREDYVRRDDVVASYTQLKQAGAHVVGTVLNYCDASGGGYGYGYYGYYSHYGSAEKDAGSGARGGGDDVVIDRAPAKTVPAATPQEAAPSPAGLREIPTVTPGGQPASPDSTAQFLAGTHYQARTYTDE